MYVACYFDDREIIELIITRCDMASGGVAIQKTTSTEDSVEEQQR